MKTIKAAIYCLENMGMDGVSVNVYDVNGEPHWFEVERSWNLNHLNMCSEAFKPFSIELEPYTLEKK